MQKITSRAIVGEFFLALEAQSGMEWMNPISMYFKSDQAIEEYGWLGMAPAMKEWLSGRSVKELRELSQKIANRHYESTLAVKLADVRRDKTDQIMMRVRDQALRANTHWASLLSALINAGATTVGYDGKYLFDTTHEEGKSGTQSNLISVDISALPVSSHGSVTVPSVPEMQAVILQGVQAMFGFKDDEGEPMNEVARNFIIKVPVSLWSIAEAACNAPVLQQGETNLIQTLRSRITLTPVANPRLTWTDRIGIFRADGNTKALIRQEETELQYKAIAEGSEHEFLNDEWMFGIDTWRNVGPGFWQHCCQVVMT